MDEEFKILIILKICKLILLGDKEKKIRQWMNEFHLQPELNIVDHKWGFIRRALNESKRSSKYLPNPDRAIDHIMLFFTRLLGILFCLWALLWLSIAHDLSGSIMPLAKWALGIILIAICIFGASFKGLGYDIYWLRKHPYGKLLFNAIVILSILIIYPFMDYIDLVAPISFLSFSTLMSWQAYWNTRTVNS